MSDQKPKIDLKARLGKKAASSPIAGGSASPSAVNPAGPPASVPGASAMPRPSTPQASAPPQPFGAPPQQYGAPSQPQQFASAPQAAPRSSGIPAPPFGTPSRPAAAGPSNPYGALEAQAVPAPRPAQQAIRIEMGEEVFEAQRRGRKKVLVLAGITAVVGGILGFAIGGGSERAKGADAAMVGAQDLIKEIGTANAETQKLADVLKSAKEKIGKGQYPEQEVSQLGAINIPFAGKNLSGKGIGRFRPEVVSMLVEYAHHATEANEQKEKLQNVMTGAKKGILELIEQRDKPQVRWGVLLTNGPNGPWAAMQTIPPFLAKDKWPEEVKLGSGKEEARLKRYSSGNPVSDPPVFVPVDPTTHGGVCPADTLFKLRRELNDLETVLRGDDTPGVDKAGLISSGQKLTEQLKQIGRES